jgi:hypothetical protein
MGIWGKFSPKKKFPKIFFAAVNGKRFSVFGHFFEFWKSPKFFPKKTRFLTIFFFNPLFYLGALWSKLDKKNRVFSKTPLFSASLFLTLRTKLILEKIDFSNKKQGTEGPDSKRENSPCYFSDVWVRLFLARFFLQKNAKISRQTIFLSRVSLCAQTPIIKKRENFARRKIFLKKNYFFFARREFS